MDDYEEWQVLVWDCFRVVALAEAAGRRQMALAWLVVGLEWWSAKPRRPVLAAWAC